MKSLTTALAATLLAIPLQASTAKPGAHLRTEPLQARILGAVRLSNVASARSLAAPRPQASLAGTAHNLGVVGRLRGGGNVLYATSVDVQNNTPNESAVSFFFDGSSGGAPIAVQGNIANLPDGTVGGFSHVHFDDFIDYLAVNGMISTAEENAGVMGSLLLVFNDFDTVYPGRGTATARFYSTMGSEGCVYAGGTIGVAIHAIDIGGNNPVQLVGIFGDTTHEANTPQLYPNLFLNNIGFDHLGFSSTDTDVVELTAYGVSSGQQVGDVMDLTIGPGQTATVSSVLNAMHIPSSEDYVIVFAVVTSGSAAIEGIAVEVDSVTKDGSAIVMHDAAFY